MRTLLTIVLLLPYLLVRGLYMGRHYRRCERGAW